MSNIQLFNHRYPKHTTEGLVGVASAHFAERSLQFPHLDKSTFMYSRNKGKDLYWNSGPSIDD
jgi:hypothetical protein